MPTLQIKLLVSPVFKSNYGVHFVSHDLEGLANGAWYEIPVPQNPPTEPFDELDLAFDPLAELLRAANLGELKTLSVNGGVITCHYNPIKANHCYKLTPRGYKLVEES